MNEALEPQKNHYRVEFVLQLIFAGDEDKPVSRLNASSFTFLRLFASAKQPFFTLKFCFKMRGSLAFGSESSEFEACWKVGFFPLSSCGSVERLKAIGLITFEFQFSLKKTGLST